MKKRIMFFFLAIATMLAGCSKEELEDIIKGIGVRCSIDIGAPDVEKLTVMSSVDGYSCAGGTGDTLSVCDTTAPQLVLVYDDHDNVRAMYRGVMEADGHVVIDAHSTAFALVASLPELAVYADAQLPSLEQSLADDPAFAEVERLVAQAQAAGRDILDTTNTALLTACDTVFAHVFGNASADAGAKADDDPLYFVEHDPLKAESNGDLLFLRNRGVCPTFFGTVTNSHTGETKELVIPSREDYTVGSIVFQGLLLQEDIRYGERVHVPAGMYNNDVELTNWNSARAKTSVALSVLNDLLRVVGVRFTDNQKAELTIGIASAIDDAVSRCVSGSHNYALSLAAATVKGVWNYLKNKGVEILIRSGLEASKEKWAKKMLEFGAGKLAAFYNMGLGSGNFLGRIYYLLRYPNDISFCIREELVEGTYNNYQWVECIDMNLKILGGQQQTGDANEWLNTSLKVQVYDEDYNSIPGQTVQFTVEAGGGSVSSTRVVSDEYGIAKTRWRLGTPGSQVCRVAVIDPATGDEISNVVLFYATAEGDMPSGSGLFSVASGRRVRFAPGNLVYDSAYSFAAHQYDYGGYFGWGTGGNPTNTSTDWRDYPSFDDWGNYIAGGWRTLTIEEWHYVIWGRPGATSKRGAATVCGVHGMVLLPDDWQGGFNTGFDGSWGTNVYDAASWAEMESAGAVFLPAAGYRYGTDVDFVGGYGDYWSSTPISDNGAYGIYINDDIVFYYIDDYYYRDFGHSVRLARDEN